jgi:hypothetical protein
MSCQQWLFWCAHLRLSPTTVGSDGNVSDINLPQKKIRHCTWGALQKISEVMTLWQRVTYRLMSVPAGRMVITRGDITGPSSWLTHRMTCLDISIN